jgi:uncharacterized protein YjiS (DUF1127 family)
MFAINIFTAAREAFSEWRRRERAYGELMALDDRSLADIGIHRSEIPGLIYGEPDAVHAGEAALDTGIFAAHQARIAGGHGAMPPL